MLNIANSKIRKLGMLNVNFQFQDRNNMEFGDKKFDVIMASDLLHLLEKPRDF